MSPGSHLVYRTRYRPEKTDANKGKHLIGRAKYGIQVDAVLFERWFVDRIVDFQQCNNGRIHRRMSLRGSN